MNTWKVILATLVIFGAGVLTGGFVVHRAAPRPQPVRLPGTNLLDTPGPGPLWLQDPARRRLLEELKLSPPQARELEHVMVESRERFQILWDLVRPDMQFELRELRARIHRILTPEQMEKFDRFTRPRFRRTESPGGETLRPRDRLPGGTNRVPGEGTPPRRNLSPRP